jgi:hypothetical protein
LDAFAHDIIVIKDSTKERIVPDWSEKRI